MQRTVERSVEGPGVVRTERVPGAGVAPGPSKPPSLGAEFAPGKVVTALFVATVVLSLAGSRLSPSADLAVLAVVAGCCAAATSPAIGLLAAGCAWLCLNAFLVDRLGELRWHGTADVTRLAVLVAAVMLGAAGCVAGLRLSRWLRSRPGRAVLRLVPAQRQRQSS